MTVEFQDVKSRIEFLKTLIDKHDALTMNKEMREHIKEVKEYSALMVVLTNKLDDKRRNAFNDQSMTLMYKLLDENKLTLIDKITPNSADTKITLDFGRSLIRHILNTGYELPSLTKIHITQMMEGILSATIDIDLANKIVDINTVTTIERYTEVLLGQFPFKENDLSNSIGKQKVYYFFENLNAYQYIKDFKGHRDTLEALKISINTDKAILSELQDLFEYDTFIKTFLFTFMTEIKFIASIITQNLKVVRGEEFFMQSEGDN